MRRFVPSWISRTVAGIALATFFSDAGHEIATAVIPLYLVALGHGPAALAVIEGVGDFVVSLSKLAGGVLGHYVRRKRDWASVGYLITAAGTSGLGLVTSVPALVALRSAAWIGRGYRGPLRDALLADAVEKTHYGRVFGLERAGDMLGAVSGPLTAALLLWLTFKPGPIMLVAFVPGMFAAASMFFLVRERPLEAATDLVTPSPSERPGFPRRFYLFLVGVFAFGLGDFSRSFLIFLAAKYLKESGEPSGGALPIAVLLYALHNLVSAAAAYPVGALADRYSKPKILIAGYALGVVTNLLLAAFSGSLPWLVAAIVLSGIYIAVEETLEKAVVAELLPAGGRSLGFGILASTNAVGDLGSSLMVGLFLSRQQPSLGFGLAAAAGLVGVLWLRGLLWRR